MPLSSVLSPLLRRGERKKKRAPKNVRKKTEGPQPGTGGTEETPSPPSDGGEGRGEEGRCVRMPLSSVLSPLQRCGERKKKRIPTNFRRLRDFFVTVLGLARLAYTPRWSGGQINLCI